MFLRLLKVRGWGRFVSAFTLIVLLVVTGMFGYRIIEGWSLLDSLYMAVITITTVGYGEVFPLSPEGKRFTIVFIAMSFATFGYAIGVLISFIFGGYLLERFKESRMKRNLERMKDHFIICGAGDIGREIVEELKKCRINFVVVERDPESSELSSDEEVLFIAGEAEDEEVLQRANVESAKGLVSVLPRDELNVFVVLTARQLNPSLKIVSIAHEESSVKKLYKAGADRVISPSMIAGKRIATLLLKPAVVDFLDVVSGGMEGELRIEEVPIIPGSPLIGKNLKETGVGSATGAIIVGIHSLKGRTRINPNSTMSLATAKLNENDVLIALGNEEQLERLRKFVRGKL